MNRFILFIATTISVAMPCNSYHNTSPDHFQNLRFQNRAVGTIRFYKDDGCKRTLSEIASPAFVDSFATVPHETPNFGFSNAVYWARIDISDSSCTLSRQQLVLEAGVPSIHLVDCYCAADSGFIVGHSGFLQRGARRALPFLFPAFSIPPAANGNHEVVFLRFQSPTSLLLPISLHDEVAYAAHDRTVQNALGLYFGALIIMALYHLALFVYLKDRSYLYFVLFILTFALGQIITVYGFLIGQGSTRFASATMPYAHCIQFSAVAFGILFARAMIMTNRFVPKTDRVFQGLVWASVLMIVLSPVIGFMNSERILVVLNIVPPALLMYAALIAVKRKYRPGLYFVQSGLVTAAALILYNLMYGFDVFPFGYPLYFTPNIGFILTILLFSIGLADRISTIQRDRNRATAVALQNLRQSITYKEEKVHLEEELFQSRKLELIGRLFSGICHDLRNILTPLHGYAELIQRKSIAGSDIARYADGLLNAAHKTRDLTIKLLDFSRKKPRKMSPIKSSALVDDVILLLRSSLKKNVSVSKKLTAVADTVLGDPSSIQNALINLALNANDAMPDGGSLVFEVGNSTLTEGDQLLKKFEAAPGAFVTIAVSDTGTGIQEDLLPRIFEPFFTTKAPGKGTGLGLAGVYGCVKSHNGCVEVKSMAGTGSVFTLYFPVSDKIPAAQSGPSRPDGSTGSGTIMLVDDEEMVGSLMTDILHEEGYAIVPFTRSDAAVAYFKDNFQNIDCVIIDMILVDSDGLQCFGRLCEIHPAVRAILMSGATDEFSQEAIIGKGFAAVVDKPFEMKILSETIRSVISGTQKNQEGSHA
jgi:signal transduction histidine kinase/CheY-like chemotaxis protein